MDYSRPAANGENILTKASSTIHALVTANSLIIRHSEDFSLTNYHETEMIYAFV